MNDLITFTYHDATVRTFMRDEDDEPCCIALDLCKLLGLGNATKALLGLDDDQKGLTKVQSLGGTQTTNYVTESGMWMLMLRSNRPEARALRHWLTREVLPALRRTGSYALGETNPAISRIDILARKIAHRPHITLSEAAHAAGLSGSADSRMTAAHMLRALGWKKGYIAPETLLLSGPEGEA